MTIEKKLEVLREVLENGANVNITFHGTHGFSKEEAQGVADDIANKLGIESHEPFGFAWYESDCCSQIGFTVHYKENKEDKIRFLEQRLADLRSEVS